MEYFVEKVMKFLSVSREIAPYELIATIGNNRCKKFRNVFHVRVVRSVNGLKSIARNMHSEL